MLGGELDPAKAALFDSYLAEVSDREAERICAALLADAAGWTTSKLACELRRLTIGTNPKKARERYERALAEGQVGWYLNDDGAASLAVDGIAPDDAAAAKRRIDRLAWAVRRAGHPGRLGQIRKRLVVHLLDGTLEGLTREEIITALVAEARAGDAPTEGGEPERGESGGGESRHGEPECGDPAADPASADRAEHDSVKDDSRERDPAADDSSASPAPGRVEGRGRPGVEVRAKLSTLLGEDDHPGELPDLGGPVLAHLARRIVARQRGGTWSFAVCDEQGHLLCAGLTRFRPGARARRGSGWRCRGPGAALAAGAVGRRSTAGLGATDRRYRQPIQGVAGHGQTARRAAGAAVPDGAVAAV
jgi:hypothetical protein